MTKTKTNIINIDFGDDIVYRRLDSIKDKWTLHKVSETNEKVIKWFRFAIQCGATDIVKFFLEKGVNPNTPTKQNSWNNWEENMSTLSLAVYRKHISVVELLLNYGVHPDCDVAPLRTALGHSIIHIGDETRKKGNKSMIELLLKHGAQVSLISQTKSGQTALSMACSNAGNPEDIELLIKAGLDPNIIIEETKGSLIDTAIKNSSDVLTSKIAMILINNGASVKNIKISHDNIEYAHYEQYDKRSCGGNYLHYAKSCELIDRLVQEGLEVDMKDNTDKTPLFYVRNDPDLVETFLKHGADSSSLNLFDEGVIRSSITFSKILQLKPDVNVIDKETGFTVLRIIAQNVHRSCGGYKEALDVLLSRKDELGLDINLVPSVSDTGEGGGGGGSWTALHGVFAELCDFGHTLMSEEHDKKILEGKNQHVEAAKLLIKHGALPLKDSQGRTPLMVLTKNNMSVGFCQRVRFHFHKFEADYYKCDPVVYLERLEKLINKGYESVPCILSSMMGIDMSYSQPKKTEIDLFWEKVSSSSSSSPLPSSSSSSQSQSQSPPFDPPSSIPVPVPSNKSLSLSLFLSTSSTLPFSEIVIMDDVSTEPVNQNFSQGRHYSTMSIIPFANGYLYM